MAVLDINGTALAVGDAIVVPYGRVLQIDEANNKVLLEAPDGHTIVATGARIEKHATSIATAIVAAAAVATDAEFLVAAAHAGLSAERLTTNTATIEWDHTTPGQAKANVPAGTFDAAGSAAAAEAAAIAEADARLADHEAVTVTHGITPFASSLVDDSSAAEMRTTLGVDASGSPPAAHATTHEPGGTDAMAVDAAAATGSLRTLGTGAQQAAAGTAPDAAVSAHDADSGAHAGTFELNGAIATHEAATDPHTQYLLHSLTRTYYYRGDFTGTSLQGWTFASGGSGGGFIASGMAGEVDGAHPGLQYLFAGGAGDTPAGDEYAILHRAIDGILVAGGFVIEWPFMFLGVEGTPGSNSYGVYRLGLGDSTGYGDHVDGVYLEVDPSVSSAAWRNACASNSTRTKTAGSAAAQDVWYVARWVVNAAGTSVALYVNDTLIATTAANIPTGAGRHCGLSAHVTAVSVGGSTLAQHAGILVGEPLVYRAGVTRY